MSRMYTIFTYRPPKVKSLLTVNSIPRWKDQPITKSFAFLVDKFAEMKPLYEEALPKKRTIPSVSRASVIRNVTDIRASLPYSLYYEKWISIDILQL